MRKQTSVAIDGHPWVAAEKIAVMQVNASLEVEVAVFSQSLLHGDNEPTRQAFAR
jgi:hypothetical protein